MPETIYVVEDNIQSIKLHADILEVNRYQVIKSSSGNDVLEVAEIFLPDSVSLPSSIVQSIRMTP